MYAKSVCLDRLPTVLPYHCSGPQASLYTLGPLVYSLLDWK